MSTLEKVSALPAVKTRLQERGYVRRVGAMAGSVARVSQERRSDDGLPETHACLLLAFFLDSAPLSL